MNLLKPFQWRLLRQRLILAKALYHCQVRRRGALSLIRRQEVDVCNLQCRNIALDRENRRLREENHHVRHELAQKNAELVALRLEVVRYIAKRAAQAAQADSANIQGQIEEITKPRPTAPK
jgi:hypothetical protein